MFFILVVFFSFFIKVSTFHLEFFFQFRLQVFSFNPWFALVMSRFLLPLLEWIRNIFWYLIKDFNSVVLAWLFNDFD